MDVLVAESLEARMKQGFAELDQLARATQQLRDEFRMDMTRDEAKANIDAQAALLNKRWALLHDLEDLYYGRPRCRRRRES